MTALYTVGDRAHRFTAGGDRIQIGVVYSTMPSGVPRKGRTVRRSVNLCTVCSEHRTVCLKDQCETD